MAHFRARARTVDLLGRQQIAGIPTAFSELFKNAHDAYADRVEADFLRHRRLLVLRDDGVGMSAEHFTERWLVLGTENKVRGQPTRPAPRRGYRERPVLGEKGIGRLAIASIGPLLLVVTRAMDESGSAPFVGAVLHWGIFEVPGINLDEIEIPVRTFERTPDAQDVKGLLTHFAKNLDRLAGDPEDEEDATSGEEGHADVVARIRADVAAFDVDPRALESELDGPSLARDGHGTHFYVKPTDESLAAAIQARGEDRASDLQATLIGFASSMLPDSPPPSIQTAFRDHQEPEQARDLLAPGVFFTAEEFSHADHRIEGSFDDEGTFSGTVTVYGRETVEYTLSWPNRPPDCGPFDLHLAVIQPEEASSTLAPSDLVALRSKMTKLGGLYVYRDGIRILPYGRPENDWLEIEQERSKHAGRAYLSHRRMFGEVQLDGETNRPLEEKAGREGFRDNRAYRDFRDLLIFFLRNVVTDFFQSGGEHASTFLQTKTELERAAKARAEREKKAQRLRAAFGKQLDRAVADVEKARPQAETDKVLADFDRALAAADDADVVLERERDAHRRLAEVRSRYAIARPKGFGLDDDLRASWGWYRAALEALDQEVWTPASAQIVRAAQAALLALPQPEPEDIAARRLAAYISDVSDRARTQVEEEAQGAEDALARTSQDVRELVDDSRRRLATAIDQALASAAEAEDEIEPRRRAIEAPILAVAAQEREVLSGIAAQLRAVRALRNGGGLAFSDLEAIDALEEEVLDLRRRTAAELELAQLGMGIQIVGHEFNASVGAVRDALRQIKPWADENEELQPSYRQLRSGFEHLEGYLRLLAPLQRRLNRRRTRIRGADIVGYVDQLFGDRIARAKAELRASDAFKEHELVAFRSTIYPAFVALIDNALFWIGERRGPRWIALDVEGEAMLISNSGPPVRAQDRERIFELGFSRKPGGQGTGLFVVRESLAAHGLAIDVVDRDDGWAFRIAPQEGDGA